MNRRLLIIVLMACLLPLGMQAQQGTFRFAQLTDIHLTPNNPNPTEDLLRSVAQINATDSIDFVLVTGDLTEEGDRTTMEKVKSCLDLLKVPYHVVLGNHETKWSDSGCTAFGEIFGGERFEFEHKGFLFLGFNSGPLMRMAYGHVVPQDIRWMTEEMDKNGKDKPVILVTHYPLMEGDVDNWYEVTDAVRPYNVRLFIGGHYHSNRDLRYDGIPGVLMRSNLRDKERKPGYGIYEVTGDSIRVYTQRIGEPKKQWTAFSLTKQYYDRNGKAEKYPDFSVNKEYPQVKEQWMVQTGAGIYCSPAVEKDKVFVGDDMGRLTAYTLKNGKKLWSFEAGKRIVGTPAVSEGIVVFGSADRRIYGLNAKDGSLLWTVEAADPVLITDDMVTERLQQNPLAYDKDGEMHYDIISAFIKSIRGSDPDGAIYWLARMVEGGEDPAFIARRLVISASEDIGLANPNALLLANACFDTLMKVGWPEGRIPLAEATIYLATSPKSNSAYMAINNALELVRETGNLPVPLHLRNAPTKLMKQLGYGEKYKYAHDYPGNFVKQQFLPDELKDRRIWEPQLNPAEQKHKERMQQLWGEEKKW